MAELTALQTWIDATNARLTTDEALIKQQAALIAQLQAVVPPTPTPVPVPIPPAPLPVILWAAGMELGDLSEWSEETNTGTADTVAVKAAAVGIPPRTTPWVMRQSVTGASGGTRMTRYPEIEKLARAGTPFYYSWWDFFPAAISFGPADMFQILSINSTTPAGVPSPMWGIFFSNSGMMPMLGWSPNDQAPAEGPHAGEAGKRFYSSTTAVPVGSWTFWEVYLKPAADFTGALKLWLNGNLLFDLSAIKTMHPVTAALPQWIDKDGYGSGLTPIPAIQYCDDFTISLGRMPLPS